MDEILLFFTKNEEKVSKAMFSYLQNKINLIHNNLIKYSKIYIETKSNDFLSKMILNNLLYLTENVKINYFHILLFDYIEKYVKTINKYESEEFNKLKTNIIINRYKARAFYDKFNENSEKLPDIELNQTIFGQVFYYLKNINGKLFLLKKGDKLFTVNLAGEKAIDAGGPYNEIISSMCDELQSDYIDLFIKTPNHKDNLGKLRDQYTVNPNSNRNIHQKAYELIGKLMAMALTSGTVLNLNLNPIY